MRPQTALNAHSAGFELFHHYGSFNPERLLVHPTQMASSTRFVGRPPRPQRRTMPQPQFLGDNPSQPHKHLHYKDPIELPIDIVLAVFSLLSVGTLMYVSISCPPLNKKKINHLQNGFR